MEVDFHHLGDRDRQFQTTYSIRKVMKGWNSCPERKTGYLKTTRMGEWRHFLVYPTATQPQPPNATTDADPL